MKRLGEKIEVSFLRSLRHEREMSQRNLARKAGISRGRLHRLEAGRLDNATYEELRRIAGALDIGVEELFRPDGAENGHLAAVPGSRNLRYEGSEGKYRIVSLLTPRADIFVGKLILAANREIASSEIPSLRSIFLQALLGGLCVLRGGKRVEIAEGGHLSFSGLVPYQIVNSSVRDQISLMITSPAPAFL